MTNNWKFNSSTRQWLPVNVNILVPRFTWHSVAPSFVRCEVEATSGEYACQGHCEVYCGSLEFARHLLVVHEARNGHDQHAMAIYRDEEPGVHATFDPRGIGFRILQVQRLCINMAHRGEPGDEAT